MGEAVLRGMASHAWLCLFYVFLAVFALMAIWEFRSPCRRRETSRGLRWLPNLALTFLNAVVLRLFFPSAVVGAAFWAERLGFGLFHWFEVPAAFAVVFTVVVMDWVVYYTHRAYHAVPLFWKIHRTHHTDTEVDVTTGTRFHTFEALLSMLIKSFFILLLGAPPSGAFLFEAVLNAVSLFSHSNVRVPARLDKALRLLIVTPDTHRIHHSVIPAETDSDFGFIFTIWDRLLGTYRPQPEGGHENMRLGLEIFREGEDTTFTGILRQPFLDKNGRFAWNNLMRVE